MSTLAELILERDKERGRRRSLALRQGRVTQSQPKISQPIALNEGEARLLAVCGVAPPGVVLRLRFRRRALHPAKIRASNVPIIYRRLSNEEHRGFRF